MVLILPCPIHCFKGCAFWLLALQRSPNLVFNAHCVAERDVTRGIAQSGSAPALGAGGRGFESLCPDQVRL